MCGIAGVITHSEIQPSRYVLEQMGNSIAHRGPDDVGYLCAPGVGFCHRRLSIIDLSTKAHQPMANEDESLWIIYNGEVFNYKELRPSLSAAGHIFKSSSDTEVILHSYEEYGVDCLHKLNGMFSFGIWDTRRRRFFAARDRFGIKPFYYYKDDNTFVFASEIKALLSNPAVPLVPDREMIHHYLMFGNTLSEKSWYSGIYELPPGCYLILEDGKLTIHSYWDVRFEPDYSRSFASFAEELQSTLGDAVRLHLRSDVPVGAYLSGGIDSSAIVSLASRETNDAIHTFSAAFSEGREFDEREFIRIVSGKYSTHHHEIIPTHQDLVDFLPTMLWHLDEPVIGPAILPMYKVCGLIASSGIKVVNGGQGGDELFGGYPPFMVAAVRDLISHALRGDFRFPLAELSFVPAYLIEGGAVQRLLSRLVKTETGPKWLKGNKDLRDEVVAKWKVIASGDKISQQSSFDQMSYLNIKYFLKGLLQQEDRMSMAWSIESRVPLLDYRVVELSQKIPFWMKVKEGVLKSILRESVRGIVPDAILDRRDKKGYPTPTSLWFSRELSGYLQKTLVKENLVSTELVEPSAVSAMVDSHSAGVSDYGATLWRILNVELWLRGVTGGWKDVRKRPE